MADRVPVPASLLPGDTDCALFPLLTGIVSTVTHGVHISNPLRFATWWSRNRPLCGQASNLEHPQCCGPVRRRRTVRSEQPGRCHRTHSGRANLAVDEAWSVVRLAQAKRVLEVGRRGGEEPGNGNSSGEVNQCAACFLQRVEVAVPARLSCLVDEVIESRRTLAGRDLQRRPATSSRPRR